MVIDSMLLPQQRCCSNEKILYTSQIVGFEDRLVL